MDRIKRKEEGVEAFLGQRFHDAMEWLYGEQAFRVVPLEELLDYYEKDWAKQWHAEVKINKQGRTQDEYRLIGRRFIEDYYKRHQPFEEGRVLGLERYIRFPLDEPGRYKCKGIIDRLRCWRRTGPSRSTITRRARSCPARRSPTRTGSSPSTRSESRTSGPRPRRGSASSGTRWPSMSRCGRPARPRLWRELKAGLAALIDRIEAETEFPVNESALCGWCAYWDLCPARSTWSRSRRCPADKWKDEPGVVIVDAYAERWRKKKALETEEKALNEEIDGLRDAAIAFAERRASRS